MVCLQMDRLNRFDAVIMTFIRLLFPIWFAYLLIMAVFRIGVKKRRDRCVMWPWLGPRNRQRVVVAVGSGILLQCRRACAELPVPFTSPCDMFFVRKHDGDGHIMF